MSIKIKNIGFYIGYICFLIGQLMGHTMIPISSEARYFVIAIGMIFLIGHIALTFFQYKYNNIYGKSAFFILFCIVSIISAQNSNEPIIILDLLFILAAKDVDFNKILKVFVITATTLLIFTVICNSLGFIQNVSIQRGDIIRHTFGYRFPTDFVQLIVYILLADLVLCIEYNKNIMIRILIYIFMGFFTLIYSDARLGSGTIFSLIAVTLILKYGKPIILSKLMFKIEEYIFLFCTCLSIFIMNNFISRISNIYLILDKFTSYRLTNTDMGIKFFGYTLWGQDIYSSIDQFFKGWFYIDSSYYVFLLEYGIGLLILVEIGYIWTMKRCIKLKNYIIPFICMIISLDSLIDQQFYLLEYNVFLLIPLAKISSLQFENY